jgi:hypothetical protein
MRQLCLAVFQIVPHIFFIIVTARVFLNLVEGLLVTLQLLYDSTVKMNYWHMIPGVDSDYFPHLIYTD